ncbi:hypothetical protein [Henriciella aquimarina]|uniref:hypothetical protein n=1 Tax=Henriciella aquimarina TaxID=545261 RepID=UPI00117B49A8|nr:hypothetical protein [Henriciella aquimarina]
MHDSIDGLIFSLEMSRRYHVARRDFLQRWIRRNQFLTLFFSAGVTLSLLEIFPPQFEYWLTLLASLFLLVLSLASVIVNLHEKVDLHHSLSNRFRALKAKVRSEESNQPQPNPSDWVRTKVAEWTAERELIEADEPQIFGALQDDIWCATAVSMGRPVPSDGQPKGIRRWLKHYLPFEDAPEPSNEVISK